MSKKSEIKFSNLRAEMGRNGVTIQGIADLIDVNRNTASHKLSGKSPITLSEAFKIEQALFPGTGIRYLFAELLDDCRLPSEVQPGA